MKKVKKQKSLYTKMLQVTVIPIFLLAIVITSFSAHSFSNALNKEVRQGLMDVSETIMTLYDTLYPGEYSVAEQDGAIYMLKGKNQLNGNFEIIDTIKDKTGVDITIFYQDVRVITTLYQDGKRMVGTKVNSVVKKDVLDTGKPAFYPSVAIGDKQYFAYYTPILSKDGGCIGMLFVAKPTQEVVASKMASILPIILLGIIAMVIAGAYTMKFSGELIRAIGKIEEFLGKVAKGNLNEKLDYDVSRREDELGEMGRYAVNMQKALSDLVEKDALTGLFNRRYGDKKLNEAHKDKVNHNIDFCIAIGDIDYFKKVNDTYGHDCGDRVLEEVAFVLKKYMKGRGFASRWGGEEFLLVFTDCELQKAKERVEEIMQVIRETKVNYKEETVRMTMTFGISQGSTDSVDALIRDADEKLYQGKKNGRNQIVQ